MIERIQALSGDMIDHCERGTLLAANEKHKVCKNRIGEEKDTTRPHRFTVRTQKEREKQVFRNVRRQKAMVPREF